MPYDDGPFVVWRGNGRLPLAARAPALSRVQVKARSRGHYSFRPRPPLVGNICSNIFRVGVSSTLQRQRPLTNYTQRVKRSALGPITFRLAPRRLDHLHHSG